MTTPDSYLTTSDQAPDDYAEFLFRTSSSLVHEPTAATGPAAVAPPETSRPRPESQHGSLALRPSTPAWSTRNDGSTVPQATLRTGGNRRR